DLVAVDAHAAIVRLRLTPAYAAGQLERHRRVGIADEEKRRSAGAGLEVGARQAGVAAALPEGGGAVACGEQVHLAAGMFAAEMLAEPWLDFDAGLAQRQGDAVDEGKIGELVHRAGVLRRQV